MKGKKKISDYLTDKKFSLFQKEKQFVVCSGNEIVWLVNERIDNRYRIHTQSKRALLLRVAD
jgi:tRNA(Ile)-lysidine synthase